MCIYLCIPTYVSTSVRAFATHIPTHISTCASARDNTHVHVYMYTHLFNLSISRCERERGGGRRNRQYENDTLSHTPPTFEPPLPPLITEMVRVQLRKSPTQTGFFFPVNSHSEKSIYNFSVNRNRFLELYFTTRFLRFVCTALHCSTNMALPVCDQQCILCRPTEKVAMPHRTTILHEFLNYIALHYYTNWALFCCQQSRAK